MHKLHGIVNYLDIRYFSLIPSYMARVRGYITHKDVDPLGNLCAN